MKHSVLFLFTGNSCRSQMAEGLLRHLGGDEYESASAGMEPTSVHPMAVRAMAEIGIDISGHRSKDLAEFLGRRKVDTVIIVCDRAARSCPAVWPGAFERLVWPLDDPAEAEGTEEQRMAVFRRVRDEIREKLEGWLARQP